jgi:hypothetical protein
MNFLNDHNTGFLKPTNGISVHLDPNKVRRFGLALPRGRNKQDFGKTRTWSAIAIESLSSPPSGALINT